RDHPDQREKGQNQRNLKDNPEGEQKVRHKGEVVTRRDQFGKVVGREINEPAHRVLQHHGPQRQTCHKEQKPCDDKWDGVLLLVYIETGRDKGPDLVQNYRERRQETCRCTHQQIGSKPLTDPKDRQSLVPMSQYVGRFGQWPGKKIQNLLAEDKSHDRKEHNGNQRLEDTPAQFLQVFHQGHRRRIVRVLAAAARKEIAQDVQRVLLLCICHIFSPSRCRQSALVVWLVRANLFASVRFILQPGQISAGDRHSGLF